MLILQLLSSKVTDMNECKQKDLELQFNLKGKIEEN